MDILLQMADYETGYISIAESKIILKIILRKMLLTCIEIDQFVCDERLNWLIRDHRHLLDSVYYGKCSNGTRFQNLSPGGFIPSPSSAPSAVQPIKLIATIITSLTISIIFSLIMRQ